MNNLDLNSLIRTSVGFDRLVRLMDSSMRTEASSEAYPPYNIEQIDENSYRIVMAVAGFGEGELSVTVHDNTLIITGKSNSGTESVKYLHRGIAGRAFEKHFQLADFIKIGTAALKNGLLSVDLVREVPEALKPRKIQILSQDNTRKLIEQQK